MENSSYLSRFIQQVHAQSDHQTWQAFTDILCLSAQLGGAKRKTEHTLFRAALAVERPVAQVFGRMVQAALEDKKVLTLFSTSGDMSFAKLAPGFDQKVFLRALDKTSPELVNIAGQAKGVHEKVKVTVEKEGRGQSEAGKTEEGVEPQEGTDSEPEGGSSVDGAGTTTTGAEGGTTTTGTTTGTTTKGTEDDDEGDDPRDTPPPEMFGEDLPGEQYGISIHKIECQSTTTWSSLDDEIIWVCDGYQMYDDYPFPIRINFASREHEDVQRGDRLSRLQGIRTPNEERTKITKKEDRLAARIWTKMRAKNGFSYSEYFGTFSLDKFIKMEVEITLLESDSSQEKMIGDFFDLITGLLGAGVASASIVNPITSIAAGISGNSSAASADPFQRLAAIFRRLINEREPRIGVSSFTVRKPMIEAAFNAGPVMNDAREGFDYVAGPSDTYTGKGGRYIITLRYERYSS